MIPGSRGSPEEENGNPLQYALEKAMAPHSSTLAWKIPWTQEPGRLQSLGSQRVGHDFTFTFHFHALEKEMATHSSVLAWRIPETVEPGWLPSMRSDMTEATLQYQQPVCFPGQFHGQRNLAGTYSSWGCQELDTTK